MRLATKPEPSPLGRWAGMLLPGAIAAAAMYLFDPDRGRSRRAQFRQRIAGTARRGSLRAQKKASFYSGKAEGLRRSTIGRSDQDLLPPNDPTLASKIESEVLGGSEYPKRKISVNVEGGVVVLRGEVDDRRQLSSLEEDVKKVPGVLDVDNLLHLPGDVPPNKSDAVEASRQQ